MARGTGAEFGKCAATPKNHIANVTWSFYGAGISQVRLTQEAGDPASVIRSLISAGAVEESLQCRFHSDTTETRGVQFDTRLGENLEYSRESAHPFSLPPTISLHHAGTVFL